MLGAVYFHFGRARSSNNAVCAWQEAAFIHLNWSMTSVFFSYSFLPSLREGYQTIQ
jgi:hypothetical protein